jgi:hypothetical protein
LLRALIQGPMIICSHTAHGGPTSGFPSGPTVGWGPKGAIVFPMIGATPGPDIPRPGPEENPLPGPDIPLPGPEEPLPGPDTGLLGDVAEAVVIPISLQSQNEAREAIGELYWRLSCNIGAA